MRERYHARVKSVVIPVPGTWRMIDPPTTEWDVGDGVILKLSGVQGLPEDPPEWLRVEAARLGATSPIALSRALTDAGWPALLAEASGSDVKLLLVMYQFLELGAVASMRAPAAPFDAHKDEVNAVLARARIAWGEPPITIAGLLAGAALPDRNPTET